MLELLCPRFVEVRRLGDGSVAFYFRIPTYYRKRGCEIANQPLGTGYETACGGDGRGGRAAALNAIFDEWNDQRRGELFEQAKIARYGSIDWPFRQYKTEKPTLKRFHRAHALTMKGSCRRSAIPSAGAGGASASDRSERSRHEPLTRSTGRLSTARTAGRKGGRALSKSLAHHASAAPGAV
jgi:hypothetical protein